MNKEFLSLSFALVFFMGAVSYRSCQVRSERAPKTETVNPYKTNSFPTEEEVVESANTASVENEAEELEGLVFSKNNVSVGVVLDAAGTGHISTLVAENGELNQDTLAEIGLNEGEIEVVEQARKELWDRMMAAAKEHTILDVLRAKDSDEHKPYVMAIPAKIGEQGLRDFENKVIRNLKRNNAAQVLQRLNWSHFFGSFGRSEVLFRVEGPGTIRWTQVNPRTGRQGSGGHFPKEYFHSKFGVLPPEVEP